MSSNFIVFFSHFTAMFLTVYDQPVSWYAVVDMIAERVVRVHSNNGRFYCVDNHWYRSNVINDMTMNQFEE